VLVARSSQAATKTIEKVNGTSRYRRPNGPPRYADCQIIADVGWDLRVRRIGTSPLHKRRAEHKSDKEKNKQRSNDESAYFVRHDTAPSLQTMCNVNFSLFHNFSLRINH
jgi:hypothetical protein